MTPPDPEALAAHSRTRRRGMVAAIACVSVAGIAFGLSYPLLVLLMVDMGASPTLIGANNALPAFGMLSFSMLTPALMRRFGAVRFILWCLAVCLVTLVLFRLIYWLPAWFVLRFALSCGATGLIVASETWINSLAADHNRGRIIAIYATVLSLGFALGPALLAAVGYAGWPPFLLGAAVTAAAGLPLLFAPEPELELEETNLSSPLPFLRASPSVMLGAAAFGAIEHGAAPLLPVYLLHFDYTETAAALVLTMFALGGMVLTYPMGWLADRIDRRLCFLLSGSAALLGALTMPFLVPWPAMLFGAALIWGGLTTGLYTVGLAELGARHGRNLAAASAALVLMYGLGALIGPLLGGALMDVWRPHGLALAIALIAGPYCALTLWRLLRRAPRAIDAVAPPAAAAPAAAPAATPSGRPGETDAP